MTLKKTKKPGIARLKKTSPGTAPKIRKILATSDFSEGSRHGVRYAVAFAEKLGAAVALLHVVEPPSRMSGMEAVVLARTVSEVAATAREHVAALAQSEAKEDVPISFSVRIGNPLNEITVEARQEKTDLIVIATHGFTGFKHAILGSVAERVVRHAPCLALTVPIRNATPGKSRKPFKLKKILVPIDFSKISNAALPWAAELAARFEAEIVLVHIVEKFPIDYLLGREAVNQTIAPLVEQARAELQQMALRLEKSTGVKVSIMVGEGKPFEEICRRAKPGVDLIALTTHGYTGLKHIWLGSTAERVVQHAPCPVLVVREKDRISS